jgi:hypothetical protein
VRYRVFESMCEAEMTISSFAATSFLPHHKTCASKKPADSFNISDVLQRQLSPTTDATFRQLVIPPVASSSSAGAQVPSTNIRDLNFNSPQPWF